MGMFESHLPCCGADVESWVASRYRIGILYCTIGRKNVRVCASVESWSRGRGMVHTPLFGVRSLACVFYVTIMPTHICHRITENDAAHF